MTDFGREKIQEARKNGQWDKPSGPPAVTAEQIGTVAGLLKEHEPAYTNFQKMPPSVQKTYTRHTMMPGQTPDAPDALHGWLNGWRKI